MSESQLSGPSAVVYAKDLQRLAAFYQAVLGLERVEEGASFAVLHAASLELVVVQTPGPIAVSIEIGNPPEVRESTPIKLSFDVASVEAVRATVQWLGGALKPAQEAWSWRGSLLLDGHDPEGNVFQLREREA